MKDRMKMNEMPNFSLMFLYRHASYKKTDMSTGRLALVSFSFRSGVHPFGIALSILAQ